MLGVSEIECPFLEQLYESSIVWPDLAGTWEKACWRIWHKSQRDGGPRVCVALASLFSGVRFRAFLQAVASFGSSPETATQHVFTDKTELSPSEWH